MNYKLIAFALLAGLTREQSLGRGNACAQRSRACVMCMRILSYFARGIFWCSTNQASALRSTNDNNAALMLVADNIRCDGCVPLEMVTFKSEFDINTGLQAEELYFFNQLQLLVCIFMKKWLNLEYEIISL